MKVSLLESLRLGGRLIANSLSKRPFCVSFEITASCNARCKHCDRGGIKKEENLLEPKEYGILASNLKPLVVQISGGEPLLRKDVAEIIREIKKPGHPPFLILVTNGSLLNEERYLNLKNCGVNQFSISLDFPDKRHDEFRGISGLFSHLEKLIPRLARFGNGDIVLNTAITSKNTQDLLTLAEIADDWGISISYSAYTPLRTGDKELCVSGENLKVLRQQIDGLLSFKRKKGRVLTPPIILENIFRFFSQGCFLPGCKAGIRSFVISPDGYFTPCAMQPVKYFSLEEMKKDFSKNNKCAGCYVSIRASTEIGIRGFLEGGVYYFLSRFLEKSKN